MEIWKEIKNYEDYQISNLGRIRSMKFNKCKILKLNLDSNKYLVVNLCKNKKVKTNQVHKLVAIAFLNHIPNKFKLVVNHKDFNRQNNNVSNLEIITNRQNTNQSHFKSSSKYTGVSWNKINQKWTSQIKINGKLKYLGSFNNEIEASNAYQNALKKLI